MEIEQWPLDKFIPYLNNPRRNDDAVNKTASAIQEWGCRVPLIAKSDGTLIDGHLRLKAARKLNLKTVPVLLADDMTPAQIKSFRISVNQISNLAEWDLDLLKLEIEGLNELDFDLDLLGFDDLQIGEILGEIEEIEEVDQFNETFNFSITCNDLVELAEAQRIFGVTSKKTTLSKLIEAVNENSDS